MIAETNTINVQQKQFPLLYIYILGQQIKGIIITLYCLKFDSPIIIMLLDYEQAFQVFIFYWFKY